MKEAVALQLCPFSDYLEQELAHRFELVRWFELSAEDKSGWLRDGAPRARAVVTGGHLGCPNDLAGQLPELGIIAINGVGFDKVDLDYCRGRGIAVTTTLDAPTEDVADLCVGLIVSLLRRLPQADTYVRRGAWLGGDMPLAVKVSGKTFGIVGLGRIGSAIAARLRAFGPIAYTDPTQKNVDFAYHASLPELARAVEVLVVASSANATTHNLIDRSILQALGPKGFLINVARGSLIDEPALIAALQSGEIAGAALDVFADEPNVPQALMDLDNVVLTPHVASGTNETRRLMADMVLANLDAFLASSPLPMAIC